MTQTARLLPHVDRLRRQLDVDVCSFYQAREPEQLLELVATSGLNPRAVGATFAYSQGLTGKVARTGKPVAARDSARHPEFFHVAGSDEEEFRSYLGIPLHRGDALLGVLVIQTRAMKTFFAADVRALYEAAGRLAAELGPVLADAG